ncbi:hypothetical protein WA026_022761 [Henosepilachna vigintioctopunctata]|uniref:PiggyBac transposable element-derived protein domain-containing protein n=1 Tax=Henosepilachna vigintioctopunctata TaxID=420089 RepID=A0AAW1URZ9_9CUCU
MDEGFNKGQSDNLPKIDGLMKTEQYRISTKSVDEIVQAITQKNVRVSSNITLPTEREIGNHSEEDDNIVEENDLEEVESRPGSSSKPKNEIIWRKHLQLEPSQFIWSETPPSEIRVDLPRAPVDYISKYISESLIEDFAFNTNMYVNMARDRFLQMKNNSHVIDNNSIPQNDTDRFIEVRSLYDSVRKRFLELELEQILSVDEQIVPFRGKLEVKQYVKGKHGDLRRREIHTGGTIRINRFGKPPLITNKEGSKKDRGFIDQVTDNTKDVVVIKWNGQQRCRTCFKFCWNRKSR